MTGGLRAVCVLAGFAAQHQTLADATFDEGADRIAAHFEALSSRLQAADAAALARFVTKAETIPGAKLIVLVPAANDPARARFITARVAELERIVRPLVEAAEFRKVPGSVAADTLWLEIVLADPVAPPQEPVPSALQPVPMVTTEALTQPIVQTAPPSGSAADVRLADWVVRGVKHSPHGPTYAYVAKAATGEAPREVVENQIDKDLGLIRDIRQSPEGSWIVHTEIGWIAQAAPSSSFDSGGH
jgi:hypothetical protein